MLAYIPYMDPMGMALECMLAWSDTTIFMNELESCGCKRTRFCSGSVWPPQFLPRTAEIHFRHHRNCREAFFSSVHGRNLCDSGHPKVPPSGPAMLTGSTTLALVAVPPDSKASNQFPTQVYLMGKMDSVWKQLRWNWEFSSPSTIFPGCSTYFCSESVSNMFAANPRFARGESRISFDMLKSMRRV